MRILPLLLLLACKGDPTPPPNPDCVVGFADRDGDGFGNPAMLTSDCQEPVVQNDEDCDDGFNTAYPGAPEICDLVDNDCDGLIDSEDDELDLPAQWLDGDGDGAGAGPEVNACEALPNHAYVDGDCDDADPAVGPNQPEICDHVDNNCDGEIDDEDQDDLDFAHLDTWFIDSDGDGVAGPVSVSACEQPVGGSLTDDDCNDTDPLAFPGAEERCNGMDDDCDFFGDDNCAPYLGTYEGPITVTVTDTATHTCTGTASVTIELFNTPAVQGTYSCTFDGTEGWDTLQDGAFSAGLDHDGDMGGTIGLLGSDYDLTGTHTGAVVSLDGTGLWVDGLDTHTVSYTLSLTPAP